MVHDRDAVRHGHGFLLVVGHVDERDAYLGLDPLQLDLHRLAQLQVKGTKRLVEKEDTGMVDQRTRQRHALLLPAGELVGSSPLVARQLHQLEHGAYLPRDFRRIHLAPSQPESHVLEDAEVGEERVVLEDGVYVTPERGEVGDVAVAKTDDPAGRELEAADHAQGGRLAAPGRPQH